MKLTDSEEYKHKMANGPAMVVQEARCNWCRDWREFDDVSRVMGVGPYECVIGPACEKCERNPEGIWVLYFAPAAEMAGVGA